jgi:hypothetical protein
MNIGSVLHPRGRFRVEHVRDGKILNVYECNNGVTNEGKNNALDVLFNGGTGLDPWYLGLIDNTAVTLAAGDTYDEINQAGNGWDEFSDYTDAANADSALTRPVWLVGSPATQAITNPAPIIFDITGTGTVHGLFACAGPDADTKDDHTASGNVLWATAAFTGGNIPVLSADQLRVSYTVSM